MISLTEFTRRFRYFKKGRLMMLEAGTNPLPAISVSNPLNQKVSLAYLSEEDKVKIDEFLILPRLNQTGFPYELHGFGSKLIASPRHPHLRERIKYFFFFRLIRIL